MAMHVGPNGYAYVPVRDCGGNAGLVFSADGGVSWTERVVPNSKVQPHGSDPSIAIGSQNTIYFFYVAANSDVHRRSHVRYHYTKRYQSYARMDESGRPRRFPWNQECSFPRGDRRFVRPNVQPADDARAAVGFVGTNQAGNYEGPTFPGVLISPS